MNHLNKYYRNLQQHAEQCHRDDMELWQWMHEDLERRVEKLENKVFV